MKCFIFTFHFFSFIFPSKDGRDIRQSAGVPSWAGLGLSGGGAHKQSETAYFQGVVHPPEVVERMVHRAPLQRVEGLQMTFWGQQIKFPNKIRIGL